MLWEKTQKMQMNLRLEESKMIMIRTSISKLLHLLVLLILVSCIAAQNGNKKSTNLSGDSSTSDDKTDFTETDSTSWYSQSEKIKTVTIDENTQSSVHIMGAEINDFLNTDNNNLEKYCVLIKWDLTNATSKKHLRVRAIPQILTTDGAISRIFRVDLADDTNNKIECSGTANSITDTDVAWKPEEVCTGCLDIITATTVTLFKSNSTSIGDEIDTTKISLSSLSLRIDLNSNTSTPESSCTSNTCLAQTFDCCVDGQCIMDGSTKPGTFTDPSDVDYASYQQSQAMIDINKLSFLWWPKFYYQCQTRPPETDDPETENPDPTEDEATKQLAAQIDDYHCLNSLRCFDCRQLNKTCEECQQDGICVDQAVDGGYDCPATTPTINDTASACTLVTTNLSPLPDMTHSEVIQRVRSECGCAADPTAAPPNDPDTVCPEFFYIKDIVIDGFIKKLKCSQDDPNQTPTPFQQLKVPVPGRSAPHRLYFCADSGGASTYNSDGSCSTTPIEILNKPDVGMYSTSGTQEGENFYYLAADDLSSAENGSFNMNSILGRMSNTVVLNKAQPALMVSVPFGIPLIISAMTGYYSPCSGCNQNDSWFPAFSAHPSSSQGLGLRAKGHTHNRAIWSTNYSNGNYDDTIFGRACWIPPTMLPFSHKADTDLQTQRLNRLKTQAAYYINGYQRDWFGFNKGAIIGSFDGVKWFAVGVGRKVETTSTKLFLAINGPMSDLAAISPIEVNIVEDSTSNDGAEYDYDPQYPEGHPNQNIGASCQLYHQCDADADCVAKLGWEYRCTEITSFKSYWPKFNINGNEIVNEETSVSYPQILQGNAFPSGSLKRCTYRGAGAPCIIDPSLMTSKKLKQQFTCAPNFFCASITSTEFNKQIARDVDALDFSGIKFGQEADFMGRPQNYVTYSSGTGNKSPSTLPTVVQTTIDYNASNSRFSSNTFSGNVGICRPGKLLSNNDPIEQHKAGDNNSDGPRTDYISQISSCDSATTGVSRTNSCPVFNADGNLIYIPADDMDVSDDDVNTSGTVDLTDRDTLSLLQNSCGAESLDSNTATDPESLFASMEALVLGLATSLPLETLVKDACLRRAGAICQTDLDCGPNRLHKATANRYDKSSFGGTEAEKYYWEEELICGQAQPIPNSTDPNYITYDLTKNRCCREIGQEITVYSEDISEEASNNPNLTLDRFPSTDPHASGRYSRYMNVANFSRSLSPVLVASTTDVTRDLVATTKIDGIVLVIGDRVLLKDQSTASQNGIYDIVASGTTWTRASDADSYSASELYPEMKISVLKGKKNESKQFTLATTGTLVIDTTDLTFEEQEYAEVPKAVIVNATTAGVSPSPYQWKSIMETTSKSCCGGGFIRQFSQSSTSWSDPNRLKIDSSKFKCLNYRNKIAEEKPINVSLSRYNADFDFLCSYLDIDKGYRGCLQSEFADTDGFRMVPPVNEDTNVAADLMPSFEIAEAVNTNLGSVINTFKIIWGAEQSPIQNAYNNWVAYPPTPVPYTGHPSVLGDRNTDRKATIYMGDCVSLTQPTNHTNIIAFYLPIYINGLNDVGNSKVVNITQVDILDEDGVVSSANIGWRDTAWWDGTNALAVGYSYDNTTGIFVAGYNGGNGTCTHGGANGRRYVRIYFTPPGTEAHAYSTEGTVDLTKEGFVPGNAMYYLDKLGRFELLGIPQITYEPLYCNTGQNDLVEGLYDVETRASFEIDSISFVDDKISYQDTSGTTVTDNANSSKRVTSEEHIILDKVFSSHKFNCCILAGEETTVASKCCSGHSVTTDSIQYCKLPTGLDLNVYLNRFISNEGAGENIDINERFKDSDFDPFTGEPQLRGDVFNKIQNFGTLHCETGTIVGGGAFGEFPAEPMHPDGYSGTVYSIIDSVIDYDESGEYLAGTTIFNQSGYRWNHHYYCGN